MATTTASRLFIPPPSSWGGGHIVSAAKRCVGWGLLPQSAHRHVAPTPASASQRPTLPTNGGGIRKSELRSSRSRKPESTERSQAAMLRVSNYEAGKCPRIVWLFETEDA